MRNKNRASGFLTVIGVLVFSSSAAFGAGTGQPLATAPAVIPSSSAAGASPQIVASSEDWKGKPEPSEVAFTALMGLGIVNATPGFALIGAAAKKIVEHGFVPDINDDVWIEAELGPVFAKGSAGVLFSAHLRWDFIKDDAWSFYALGGLGGSNTGDALGNKFEFYPRFGVGALWNLFADFTLRAEISHELVVVGAQFNL